MDLGGIIAELLLLASWVAAPALLAFVMASAAPGGTRSIWTSWAGGCAVVAVAFLLLSRWLRGEQNVSDAELAVSLVIGTCAATAIAAMALTRLMRRTPAASLSKRVGVSVWTALAGMAIWSITPGAC